MFDLEIGSKDKEDQRKLIQEFDKYGLSPERVKKHFVIGETVVKRLSEANSYWNQIDFDVLYPASIYSNFRRPKEGEFIFLPGRLHRWKRVDLVINAMKYVTHNTKLLIAGDGEDADKLKSIVRQEGLAEKVEFLGRVSDDKLLELYSKSIVIPFVPIREDYGYIAIEAFKSRKPVITCYDSGEPSYIVKDGLSGFIVKPDPKKIAEKINYFIENPRESKRMGDNGFQSVQDITWKNVVDKLLSFDGSVIQPIESCKMKKVLVTDNQILDPPIGGGRVRIYELYKHFDPKAFDITYLGTFDWLGPGDREQKLAIHFTEILVPMTVPHIILDRMFSRLCNSLTTLDVTIPLLMKYTPKYQRKLSQLLNNSDIVIVSHPWVYPYVRRELKKISRKIILIYDSQNVEYRIKSNILNTTLTGRFLVNNVKRIERALVKDCDLLFACSTEDAEGFSELYGKENRKKILIIPNGSAVQDMPAPNFGEKKSMREYFGFEDSLIALFLASGGYKPNDDAAEYIATKLAPKIFDVNFILVGSICDIISKKFGNDLPRNMRLMGVVSKEDKMRLLYASDIALNPVTMGSGTNIKVFDYLAAGLPLITTPVGARGINFTNCEDAIISEINEFPEKIRILNNDAVLRDKISKKARLLSEKYDWSEIAKTAEKGISKLEDNSG